jgi:hypothetical protein
MDTKEEKKFTKKQMLSFAETCMLKLLSTKPDGSEYPEILPSDLRRINQVLNNFNKDEKEYYAVYEKEPRHQNEKNGVILASYNTKEEAEQSRVKYGYGDDNYYVDKLIN